MVGIVLIVLVVPLLFVFVALLGVVLPRQIIGSGVEDLEGLDKRMARGALGDIAFHDRPGRGLDAAPPLIVRWRVTTVRKCPGTPSGEEFEEMIEQLGGYDAEVRAYALFGLPVGEARVSCRGNPEWRPYLRW